jgi:hypothetical protein
MHTQLSCSLHFTGRQPQAQEPETLLPCTPCTPPAPPASHPQPPPWTTWLRCLGGGGLPSQQTYASDGSGVSHAAAASRRWRLCLLALPTCTASWTYSISYHVSMAANPGPASTLTEKKKRPWTRRRRRAYKRSSWAASTTREAPFWVQFSPVWFLCGVSTG